MACSPIEVSVDRRLCLGTAVGALPSVRCAPGPDCALSSSGLQPWGEVSLPGSGLVPDHQKCAVESLFTSLCGIVAGMLICLILSFFFIVKKFEFPFKNYFHLIPKA